jgi:hypothetical protein
VLAEGIGLGASQGGVLDVGGAAAEVTLGSLPSGSTLSVGRIDEDLTIAGSLRGSLQLRSLPNYFGGVRIGGNLVGSITVGDPQGYYGGIRVDGYVEGDITILWDFGGDIIADADGVGGGAIYGNVTVDGVFNGDLCADNVSPDAPLPGNIHIAEFGLGGTICGQAACGDGLPNCDTGLFCSAKVCNAERRCVFDHECISTNGNPCPNPATCNEGSRTCGGCKQPTVVSIGCRYLAVTPAEQGSTPLALVVVGECSNPSAACVYQYVQSKCNLGANNGQNCLVNADCPKTCAGGLNPGTPCTTNAQCSLGTCAGTCEAGTLGSTPFYKTASQWGTAKVRGAQIRPGTDYLVETQCDFPGVVLSAATTARTWRWGDIDGNGIVNALDIAQLVDAFKGRVGSVPWEQANIWGCAPDAFLDALDITEDVDAFKGLQFPCGITCP